MINQTIPDSTKTATWNIIATVEEKNLQNPSTTKISLHTKSYYKVIGAYWGDILLPTITVRFFVNNLFNFFFGFNI